ncbi:CAT RNA binding domain-containing protein [Holdemania filiformis]|nr:CAT RNA binding domain-containing protein [Holdemania filiformis]
MKVIKKINNNVALCIDQGGKELIALGKGIGLGHALRASGFERN